MKKFTPSLVRQFSKNIFLFERKEGMLIFNRLNFDRRYLPKSFYHLTGKIAKEMEENTPKLKFEVPRPRKIRVEVNFSCNLACRYCLVFKNQLNQLNHTMNLETAQKILSFYQQKIKHGSVMISGGEPFLSWPIVKFFIEKIKDPIKIFTNGTILNDEILSTLKKAPHVRVMVSLDGQRKDNKFRRFESGKEVYYRVIKNLRSLKRNRIKVGITALCLNHNVKRLSKIVKFFYKNLGVNYMGFNFPHFTKEILLEVDMEEYADQMIKLFDFVIQNKIYIDQLAKRFSPLLTKKFRFYACKLVGEQVTFYPNGETTYCSKIDTLPPGRNYDLNYFLKVIPINNPFCQDCPAIGICGGGCFWDGLMRFKQGVDERECILNKKLLDYFLWKLREFEVRINPPISFFRHII
jgi:radical SAM protein with 4Fe4S-binding SPASM domain